MRNGETCVSVIVPCCGVENYVGRCLESVLNQTHENIEILLVCRPRDENDRTFTICREFSEKDRRIRLLEQESKGLGLGRDLALDVSAGAYVCSVDGDDYVLPDYVEKMLDAAVRFDADIVQCRNSRNFHPNGGDAGVTVFQDYQEYFEYTYRHSFDEYAFTMYSFWGCLYKRSLLSGLRFGDYRVCEDQLFQLRAIHRAGKFVCLRDVLYHYTLDDASGVRRAADLSNLDEIRVGDDIMAYLECVQSKLYNCHFAFNVGRYHRLFLTLCRDCYADYERFAHLKTRLCEMLDEAKEKYPALCDSYVFHKSLKDEFERLRSRSYIVYGYGTWGVNIVKWFRYFEIEIQAVFDIRGDNRSLTDRHIPFVKPCADFKRGTPIVVCLGDRRRVAEIMENLRTLGYANFLECGEVYSLIVYGATERFLPECIRLS